VKGHHRSLTPHVPTVAVPNEPQDPPDATTEKWWKQRLPTRPVSAYEVYKAQQQETRQTAGAAWDVLSADVSDAKDTAFSHGEPTRTSTCAAGESAVLTPPPQPQQELDGQRTLAVAWLQLSPQAKQRYEAVAQWWFRELQHRSCAESTATTSATPTANTATEEAAVFPQEGGTTDALSVAPAAGVEAPTPPPLTTTSVTKRSRRPAMSTKNTRGPAKTSFHLFRAETKGRGWSMAEAAAVWQRMSVAEKARYDAAAARYRTATLLPLLSSQQQPSSSSPPPPPPQQPPSSFTSRPAPH
jgi:hypothetical protein